jgi:hypothetical protein
MNLIDRYVAEVGKHLLLRGRGDIEAELRSTLEDMLEDRSQKEGRPVDEAMAIGLLKEYGPPEKVAATYHPTQYLIGPRLYPFFLFVLKIVFSVLTVVLLVQLGIQLATHSLAGPELAKAIGNGLLEILMAAIQAFGNIVLVFAILERVMPGREFKLDDEKKEWDPASLMKEPEPDETKPWEPIAGIAFTAAAMIIFNLYPQLIGFTFLKDDVWTFIPALTDAFFRWMPYINVLWALQIALNVVLLRRGRWQASTKWSSIVLDIAGIVIGYLLLSGPSIVGLSPEALRASGLFDGHTADLLSQTANQGARVVIAIIIVLEGVDVVKNIYKQIRKPALAMQGKASS